MAITTLCQTCNHPAPAHERLKPETGRLYGACRWLVDSRGRSTPVCDCADFVPPAEVIEKITDSDRMGQVERLREIRKRIADARRDINTASDLGRKAQLALLQAKSELAEIEASLTN